MIDWTSQSLRDFRPHYFLLPWNQKKTGTTPSPEVACWGIMEHVFSPVTASSGPASDNSMLPRFAPVSKTAHNSKNCINSIILIKLPPWGGAYINTTIISNDYTQFYIKPREDQGERVNPLNRPYTKVNFLKLLLLVATFPDISSCFSFAFLETSLDCPRIARVIFLRGCKKWTDLHDMSAGRGKKSESPTGIKPVTSRKPGHKRDFLG